ncbi:MAG: hypothetical protein CMB69_00555 [Euryarchaeota archaeon]|nr:hypothetical protein [Euryarchaeota archaeon]
MGQVYILRLRRGKWYVGYTDRGVVRVIEHIKKGGKFKGAKWTQKYPPENWESCLAEMSSDDHTKEDEDRITLAKMAEHGIRNVRGGQWCMVKMQPRTVKELESLIQKSRPKKGQVCGRCGRDSHNRARCYATTTVDGVSITTKSWKYRPKTKAKAKPKTKAKAKKSRCKGRTLYGTGPRCKLTAAKGSDYCRVHAPYYPKKKRSRR